MEENKTDKNDLVEFKTVPLEIDYWKNTDGSALINLVSDDLAELMNENRVALDYLLSVDEDELKKITKPTHDTNHLRLRFWSEFETAQKTKCKMNFRHILDGIVSPAGFYMQVHSLGKLAWILRPPKDYTESIQEALSSAMSGVREILDAEIRNDDGSYNTSVMNAKLKAFGMLDNRAKGMPTQKVLRKSLVVSVHKSSKELPMNTGAVELSEEEKVNQELMDLQQDINKINLDPRVLHNVNKIVETEAAINTSSKAVPSGEAGEGTAIKTEESKDPGTPAPVGI